MSNEYPVEIDGITGEVETLTPSRGRYRCKLDTLQDVKREMAKVYREARTGIVDVQDATKLTWCLQTVGKVIGKAVTWNSELKPWSKNHEP